MMYLHLLSCAGGVQPFIEEIIKCDKLILELKPDRIILNPKIVSEKIDELFPHRTNNLLDDVIQKDFWCFTENTIFYTWCKNYGKYYDWLRDEVFLKHKDEINPYLLQLFKFQYEQFGKKFDIETSSPTTNDDDYSFWMSVTEDGIIFSKEYICKALDVKDIPDELYVRFKYLTKKNTKTAFKRKLQEYPEMVKFYSYFMNNECYFLVEFQKFHPKIYRLLLWLNLYISKGA